MADTKKTPKTLEFNTEPTLGAMNANGEVSAKNPLFEPPTVPYETPASMRDMLRNLNQAYRQIEDSLRLMQASAAQPEVRNAYGVLIEQSQHQAACLRHLAGHQAVRVAAIEASKAS